MQAAQPVMWRWIVGGLFLGAFGATVPFWELWPMLVQRLTWRGGGESGDWGEAAFYLAYLMVPGGLLGAGLGAAVAFVRRRRVR